MSHVAALRTMTDRVIDVRAATRDDVEQLCDVHVAGWRGGYRGLFPDAYLDADEFDESRRAMWRRADWIDAPDVEVLAGTIDGRVLGFAHSGPERVDGGAPPSGRGEVYSFYLDARAWGSGLAGALMLRTEASLRRRGVAEAVLWVLRDNPRACAFYAKAGWSWSGRETVWNVPPISGVDVAEPVTEVEYIRTLSVASAVSGSSRAP